MTNNNFYPLIHFFQIVFFIGTLVNEVSNKLLKQWIKQPRPVDRTHIGEEFGMPSSHSQFIWFFSTYVTLFIFIRYVADKNLENLKTILQLFRLHHMNNNTLLPFERAGRFLVLVTCWWLTALVCLSRIYLQYHTWNQVIVGSIIGIITGLSWFLLTHLILTPLFPTIVSWLAFYLNSYFINLNFIHFGNFTSPGNYPNTYYCEILH